MEKREELWLRAWRCDVLLSGPSYLSDSSIHILAEWFSFDLQLDRNKSEVQAKVEAQV